MTVKKKVCLIVDNPLRDLDGMILLAHKLAEQNIEAFIVPFYQSYEVYFIQPSLVLVNFLRPNNLRFIDTCKKLGIKVGVLDTEGAIVQSVDGHFSAIAKTISKMDVDLYCFWGTRQLEAFKRYLEVPTRAQLVVTGSPRHDLCHERYRECLPDVGYNDDRQMILMNTNFPILQPRFQSQAQEAWNLVNIVGWTEEYTRDWINQSKTACDVMIEVTKKLAIKYPEIVFILRPHPFENKAVYLDSFKEIKNIQVIQEGNVLSWINRSRLIIHRNCSTAVESYFMGKPAFNVGWPLLPVLRQPIPEELSENPKSMDELEASLEKFLNGDAKSVFVDEKTEEALLSLYFSRDGRSAERVANAIDQVIKAPDSSAFKNPTSLVRILKLLIATGQKKEFIRVAVILVIGYKNFLNLKIKFKNVKYDHGKAILFSYVNDFNKKINLIQSHNITAVEVSPTIRNSRFKKHLMEFSIKFSAKSQ